MAARLNRAAIRIRRSRPDETARLFAIWDAAVKATHHFVSGDDVVEFAALVRERYLPSAILWVAVDESDFPMGFMGTTGARLDSLFVDPAAHGRGLGTALVEHHCAAEPVVSVEVNEQNEAAVGFYLARGFEVVGRSELDASGKPYPILRMRRAASGAAGM